MTPAMFLGNLTGQELLSIALTQYDKTKAFFLNITFDTAYGFVFLREHFPVFFVIQSIWICVVIRRFARKIDWRQSLSAAAASVFLGRLLVAFFTHRPSFLLDRAPYIPIFVVIWYLINCSPRDFVFRLLNSVPFLIVFQILYSVIQVRQVCHGLDIGMQSFPNGATGAVLLSAVLASTESIVWMIFWDGVREFSNRAVLRNLAAAIAYWALVQYHEIVEPYFVVTNTNIPVWILIVYISVLIFDLLVFGLRGRKGFDLTLLEYVGMAFSYYGNK
jgi:hypothetical protein